MYINFKKIDAITDAALQHFQDPFLQKLLL